MNTLNNKGPRMDPCGTPLVTVLLFTSYISQFYPLVAITQITGKKLTGIEINSIRWKLSNE